MLARNPSRVPPGNAQLSIVKGNARDYRRVLQVVAGCDAVLSTLGATDKHDADIRHAGTANIIAAMRETGFAAWWCWAGFTFHSMEIPTTWGAS